MLMEPKKFIQLPIDERANYLWANGEFVANRIYYNQTVKLYALNGYWVEVWINNEGIDRMEPLEDEKVLKLYISGIDVQKLF